MPTWLVMAILAVVAVAAMWAADHSKKVRQIRKVRLEHGDIDVRVTRSGQHAIIELVSEQAKDWHYKNIPGAPAVPPNSLVLDAANAGTMVRGMVRDGLVVHVPDGSLRDYGAS